MLNDYYERPYASEPNMAELPGALLRYLLLTGAIIAGLTVPGCTPGIMDCGRRCWMLTTSRRIHARHLPPR